MSQLFAECLQEPFRAEGNSLKGSLLDRFFILPEGTSEQSKIAAATESMMTGVPVCNFATILQERRCKSGMTGLVEITEEWRLYFQSRRDSFVALERIAEMGRILGFLVSITPFVGNIMAAVRVVCRG